MDLEALCILCNWSDGIGGIYSGFGGLGAAAGGFFGSGFFGGSGGGHSDDFGADETGPSGYYGPGDPWNEEHQREYEESQREESEEYEREREADRLERAASRRQEFADRPWSEDPLVDVSEAVQRWTQDLFGLDPDNPEGKGTAPTAHQM